MRELIRKILREEVVLQERKAAKPREIDGCMVFRDKDKKEFCKVIESEIRKNLKKYRPMMEKLLYKYFQSDYKIIEIQSEVLNNESEIVKKGFINIEKVVKLISGNCPMASQVADELKNKWLSKYKLYFKDSKGKYHLLNRLDSNYTAMAILITIFYEDSLEQVRMWTDKTTTPSSSFAMDWIDHFFNPEEFPLIDPRPRMDDYIIPRTELKNTPNPTTIFNKVFKPQDFVSEESQYHINFMNALQQVRAKGFKTENLFEEMLNEHGIVYKKYAYDYSFVDMILGIDFLIKQTREGSDYWVPVQVKSHIKEKYNLIKKLKCTQIIRPLLIKKDGKPDFEISDTRGFNEYFCEKQNYCRTGNKKKVYAPPSIDYFSSKEGSI